MYDINLLFLKRLHSLEMQYDFWIAVFVLYWQLNYLLGQTTQCSHFLFAFFFLFRQGKYAGTLTLDKYVFQPSLFAEKIGYYPFPSLFGVDRCSFVCPVLETGLLTLCTGKYQILILEQFPCFVSAIFKIFTQYNTRVTILVMFETGALTLWLCLRGCSGRN